MTSGRSLPLAAALLVAVGGLAPWGRSDAAAPPAWSAASDNTSHAVRPAAADGGRRVGEPVVDPPARHTPHHGGRVRPGAVPDDVFALHSRPGSSRTILIDVDGQVVAGTAWNKKGLPDGPQPAWDTDGDPGSFSNAERAAVYSVWQRVAEDYAPFDVDVTTEDPGEAALVRSDRRDRRYGVRVLVTSSDAAMQAVCGHPCGGTSFVGIFNERTAKPRHQPSWVFPQSLGNDPKPVAESAAHEAGHALGLQHHGTSTSEYYAGQGPWAPIMGVGYQRPLTQWSDGSYPDANNSKQDDVARIQRGGLPLAPDDHGDTADEADPLGTGTGVIGTRDDVDVFFLGTCDRGALVTAAPAAVGADLDISATLLDHDGDVVARTDPPAAMVSRDSVRGLDAPTPVTTRGDYYLAVDGTGWGTASTGYSDYASLGRYTVTTTGCVP